jgi:hypothetical protein
LATNDGEFSDLFAAHHGPPKWQQNMTSALTALAIAVSGTSLICFVLMTGAERSRNRRKTSADGGSDVGTYAGDDSGSHFWSWFGSDHAGGGDSSVGGDSGGGGDGSGGDGGGGD